MLKKANILNTLSTAGWEIDGEKIQTPAIFEFALDLLRGKAFVTETSKRGVPVVPEESGGQGESTPFNAKELVKLAGYLVSMSFGPVTSLRTRSFYLMILKRHSWHHRTEWTPDITGWQMLFLVVLRRFVCHSLLLVLLIVYLFVTLYSLFCILFICLSLFTPCSANCFFRNLSL